MGLTEPPFEGCPCVGCCLVPLIDVSQAWRDCAGELLTAVVHHPWVFLRSLPVGGGPRGLAVELILRYQRGVSAHRPPCCRYTPSCSHYGLAAFTRHGFWRGLRLTAGRLWRCRPTVPHGTADPLPT